MKPSKEKKELLVTFISSSADDICHHEQMPTFFCKGCYITQICNGSNGGGKKLVLGGAQSGLTYLKPSWCHELIHCGCRKSCRGLCKCYKASLPCVSVQEIVNSNNNLVNMHYYLQLYIKHENSAVSQITMLNN